MQQELPALRAHSVPLGKGQRSETKSDVSGTQGTLSLTAEAVCGSTHGAASQVSTGFVLLQLTVRVPSLVEDHRYPAQHQGTSAIQTPK